MYPTTDKPWYKPTPAKIILILVGLLILAVFYWLATHSYIEVAVSDPSSGEYSYQILNQGSQKSTTVKSSTGSVKKLVRRGGYEIQVTKDSQSYVSTAKAGGFLGTQSLTAQLHTENARRFVGNNPGTCMNYLSQNLISYSCNDIFSNLGIHEAATNTQPTFVLRNPPTLYGGYIESTLTTKNEGSLVLVKSGGTDDSGAENNHYVYVLDGSFNITKPVRMPALTPDTSYTALSYKDGFIVYSADLSQILYFTKTDTVPTTINVDKPKTKNLIPVSLSVQDDKITVLYAHSTEPGDKTPASEVIVSDGSNSKHYVLKTNYSTAVTCGDKQLCANTHNQLDVYNISQSKPALDFSLTNSLAVRNSGQNLLVIRSKDVLVYDPVKNSGFVSYSFGDYTFNSVALTGNDYVLSLTQPDQTKIALYVNQSAPNLDNIDKKIADLTKSLGVGTVSAYGTHIFISPNVGSVVYNPNTRTFGYDPARVKTANDNVNQAINKIGIDKGVYTVVNTTSL